MRPVPLANGATFAGFTIVRLLGAGDTGTVYLAEDARIASRVALKLLRSDVSADPDFRERFFRDIDIAATFDQPHITRVIERGESAGRLWLATEYIDGPDAGRLLRDRFPKGMPPDPVFMVVDRVAQALDYAHERELVHRHVKPTNIQLDDPYSDRYRILLSDFGTARHLNNVSAGTAGGLNSYAAPEQLADGTVTAGTDQYGLAATAFHLLTGTPPFGADAHRDGPPPALSDSRPDLAALDPVFARALAADPATRFETCRAFAAALANPRPAGTGPVGPRPAAAPSARPDDDAPADPPAMPNAVSPAPTETAPVSEPPAAIETTGEPSSSVTTPAPGAR